MVVNRNGAMVVGVVALLLSIGLPLAAWYAGRASVHCPDTMAELDRAEGELRRMMVIADSAQAETARWQARYDSLRSTRQRPVKQQIHEYGLAFHHRHRSVDLGMAQEHLAQLKAAPAVGAHVGGIGNLDECHLATGRVAALYPQLHRPVHTGGCWRE